MKKNESELRDVIFLLQISGQTQRLWFWEQTCGTSQQCSEADEGESSVGQKRTISVSLETYHSSVATKWFMNINEKQRTCIYFGD